jgi:ABC-2 type transport system ATP-binding protein
MIRAAPPLPGVRAPSLVEAAAHPSSTSLAEAVPAIRVEHLAKWFPHRRSWADTLRHPLTRTHAQVLTDVSLEVPAGQLFGFLGANGAGKTTLFRILSTLILPDAGRVTIGGRDLIREAPSVRQLVSPVIADERSLHWRLGARENLRLFAALHGLRGAAATCRVEELLLRVGLTDADDRMVGKFSSGMKQRLLLARALLSRPRILLLDEPTRSLDPVAARAFRDFLRRDIQGVEECTILLATHSSEEALELCDRLAVMDRGRIVTVGTPDSLRRRAGLSRYRLRTPEPAQVPLGELALEHPVRVMGTVPPDDSGWAALELEIPGGAGAVAEVNRQLVARGVSVGGLEEIRPTLAELIERVVEGKGGGR